MKNIKDKIGNLPCQALYEFILHFLLKKNNQVNILKLSLETGINTY